MANIQFRYNRTTLNFLVEHPVVYFRRIKRHFWEIGRHTLRPPLRSYANAYAFLATNRKLKAQAFINKNKFLRRPCLFCTIVSNISKANTCKKYIKLPSSILPIFLRRVIRKFKRNIGLKKLKEKTLNKPIMSRVAKIGEHFKNRISCKWKAGNYELWLKFSKCPNRHTAL